MLLKDSQKEAIRFCYPKRRSIIVMGPGKGKTLTLLSIIKLKIIKQLIKNALIIAPSRGILAYKKIDNNPGLTIHFLEKREDFENIKNTDLSVYDVVVLKDTFIIDFHKEVLSLRNKFQFVGIDECHVYRTYTNKSSKVVKRFMEHYNGIAIMMTATPFYTKLEDVYSLFSYILPELFGAFPSFADKFIIYKKKKIRAKKKIFSGSGFTYKLFPKDLNEKIGYKNVEHLYEMIKPFIYIDKESHFNIQFNICGYTLTDKYSREYSSIVEGQGLDTLYTIVLDRDDGSERRLLRSKTEKLMKGNKELALPKDIRKGDHVYYMDNNVGYSCRVKSVKEEDSIGDYLMRLVPLQLYLSKLDEKYLKLQELIVDNRGMIIYFNYIESLQYVSGLLQNNYPTRRIITLIGGDNKLGEKVINLDKSDIVCMTRVATASLDFYFDKAVIFEPIVVPGLLEQFIGRITRINSEFVDIFIYFIIGDLTIEEYFYERLLFLVNSNEFSNVKGQLKHTDNYDKIFGKDDFSIRVLKDNFLWRK